MSGTHTIAVAGTGTAIGKTWVTCQLAAHLRQAGLVVAARKPAQSFAPDELGGTDAEVLAATTGESSQDVCPEHRWYPAPFAPPMAADALGEPTICLSDLLGELRWPQTTDIALVELAGGVASPLAHDGDCSDLVDLLRPDHTILVADAELGTLSACRLAVRALPKLPLTIVLNRFRPDADLHRRNVEWLTHRDGLHVVTDRELAELSEQLRSDRIQR